MPKASSRRGFARLLSYLPAAALALAVPVSAQTLKDLVYTTVTPCICVEIQC